MTSADRLEKLAVLALVMREVVEMANAVHYTAHQALQAYAGRDDTEGLHNEQRTSGRLKVAIDRLAELREELEAP